MGRGGRKQSRVVRPQRAGASQRAKLFWTGRSQAVRLPKDFRFLTSEVEIHREGERVVLEPPTLERDVKGWPVAWWQLAASAPEFEVGVRARVHERGNVLKKRP
jgi:hypothetical protein